MKEIFSLEVERILALKLDEDPPLIEYRAAIIEDRKLLGEMLKRLDSNLDYLKRVKHQQDGSSSSLVLLKGDDDDVDLGTDMKTVNVMVPAVAPLLPEQAKLWSTKFWPVSRGLESSSCELEPKFTVGERTILSSWMKEAWSCCIGSEGSTMGVVIVDPRNNEVVAKSGSRGKKLRHATMIAISNAAKKISHAKLNMTTSSLSRSETYLCTGFDVFLTHEPCCMCAMALLHSRVRRVFWDVCDLKRGALGSVVRLHTLPNINHRYRVYQGFLPEGSHHQLSTSSPSSGGCYEDGGK